MTENPWIEHDGGPTPVAAGQHFERKHRNGDKLRMKAWHGNMRRVVWEHRGDDRDITHYRLTGPSA